MNSLRIIATSALLSCLIYSCSSSRNSSGEEKKKRTKITTINAGLKNPSSSVINASGDGLSQGINQSRGAGSKENATNIAFSAIEKANAIAKAKLQNLESMSDKELISTIAALQQVEITVSNNTRQTTTNDKIKDYALLVFNDHTEIKKELDKLSTKKNVALAPQASLKGAPKTDLAFVKMMIESNRNIIELFTAASNSKDADLRTFSLKQLPVLKKHLEAAQELTKEVKSKADPK
jgi:predicted outer membrane protein